MTSSLHIRCQVKRFFSCLFHLLLVVLGLRCCLRLSLAVAGGGLSSLGCMGFSLQGLLLCSWKMEHIFQVNGLGGCSTWVVVAHQLHVESSKTRD